MICKMTSLWTLALVATLVAAKAILSNGLRAGVGIADVTGPTSDVNLMGYAMPQQTANGVFFRLRARAFVFGPDDDDHDNDDDDDVDREMGKRVFEKAERLGRWKSKEFYLFNNENENQNQGENDKPQKAKGTGKAQQNRIVFVSVDNGMASYAVTRQVAAELEKLYPGMYSQDNICISGTHTHSAAAGFLQNVLFQVTSLGFVHEAFDSFVKGIVRAIVLAHESSKTGRKISIVRDEMEAGAASINRSPSAYLNNPEEERAKYEHNVDLNHTIVAIEESDGTPVGMISWFATHGTTMPNTNGLVNGDNKGYASGMMELSQNGPEYAPGSGPYVAAFAATNLGDVSPNINGTFCTDDEGKPTGVKCEELHSTCKGKNENCHGRGPSWDPFESVAIIGSRQAKNAEKMLKNKQQNKVYLEASGNVGFVHAFRHFPSIRIEGRDNEASSQVCKPSMGYSFAAGTTDGPGAFNFVQSEKTTNPFWEFVRNFLKKPSDELERCQHPKPVLLPTGEMNVPYPWDPATLPLQILRIGKQFAILSLPAELTTMAGRRMRDALRTQLIQDGTLDSNGIVVVAGLSNDYASYCTTKEEYQVQRYEAASTLFGPNTLEAYIQEMSKLARVMAGKEKLDKGPTPENLLDKQISLLPYPLPDTVPSGAQFGAIEKDVEPVYDLSKDPKLVVSVTFHGANPRNDPRLEGTFLVVEKKLSTGSWKRIATDSDFDTRFIWHRESLFQSKSIIEWRPYQSLVKREAGTYRIGYFGDRKQYNGAIVSFNGYSSSFELK